MGRMQTIERLLDLERIGVFSLQAKGSPQRILNSIVFINEYE